MEKLLLKVNSLSDVRDDPLPLSQLFASRGLYYAALSVAASQPTALRTIAEEIEARARFLSLSLCFCCARLLAASAASGVLPGSWGTSCSSAEVVRSTHSNP